MFVFEVRIFYLFFNFAVPRNCRLSAAHRRRPVATPLTVSEQASCTAADS